MITYKGPTTYVSAVKNADADLMTREIVEVLPLPVFTAADIVSQSISSFPTSGSADFTALTALYNEYRTLSQVIEYVPGLAVPLFTSNILFPGFVTCKVARGDTVPTLAALTDIDTSCVLAPSCSTSVHKLATIRMCSTAEATFSDTNTPTPVWSSIVTMFALGAAITSGLNPGYVKITSLIQFRGAL
jgi:hypothetical protein